MEGRNETKLAQNRPESPTKKGGANVEEQRPGFKSIMYNKQK